MAGVLDGFLRNFRHHIINHPGQTKIIGWKPCPVTAVPVLDETAFFDCRAGIPLPCNRSTLYHDFSVFKLFLPRTLLIKPSALMKKLMKYSTKKQATKSNALKIIAPDKVS